MNNEKNTNEIDYKGSEVIVKHDVRFAWSIRNSARVMQKKAIETEQSTVNPELRAYVTNAIFTSVVYLDAVLYEFCLLDVRKSPYLIPSNILYLLKAVATEEIRPRGHILDKYNFVLRLLDNQLFDKGCNPWQAANFARCLRNALIHPKPDIFIWSSKKGVISKDKFAISNRFSLIPDSDTLPLFPDRMLSGECARYVVNSCEEFVKDFENLSGIHLSFKT